MPPYHLVKLDRVLRNSNIATAELRNLRLSMLVSARIPAAISVSRFYSSGSRAAMGMLKYSESLLCVKSLSFSLFTLKSNNAWKIRIRKIRIRKNALHHCNVSTVDSILSNKNPDEARCVSGNVSQPRRAQSMLLD